VFVDDDGTGRRTLEFDGFSLRDLELPSPVPILWREEERRFGPRDEEGGGSPKMKNLIKAPISSTTDSWPTRRPCVKERLHDIVKTTNRATKKTGGAFLRRLDWSIGSRRRSFTCIESAEVRLGYDDGQLRGKGSAYIAGGTWSTALRFRPRPAIIAKTVSSS